MSSQPGAGDGPLAHRSAVASIATAYTPEQWRQLTRLPAQVVIAAIESVPAGTAAADRVAEAVRAVSGIASGRSFDSDLVRAVASAIYAETEREGALISPTNPQVDVLTSCRAVAQLLAGRADPADAAAYRQWVQSIAARAVGRSDGREPRPHPFLAELGRALGLS